jgi:hypothetical protein
MRAILAALVLDHERRGDGLLLGEIEALAWPRSRAHPNSMRQRAHAALASLRRLGLGPLMRRVGDRYLLDRSALVKVAGT